MLKVHAVDPRDECRHRAEGGVCSEALCGFVLLHRDEREIHGDGRDDHVARAVDRLFQTQQVVVHVAEVGIKTGTNGWDTAPVQLTGDFKKRAGSTVENHELSLETVESFDVLARRLAGENPFLDVIDLFGELIEHGKVPIDDSVHESVKNVRGTVLEKLRLLFQSGSNVSEPLFCAAPHRDHVIVSHKDGRLPDVQLTVQGLDDLQHDEE